MFDAIVVGSGMSGGWAAKELTERGLKTLVIERGRHVEHRVDYKDSLMPWQLPMAGAVPEEEVERDYPVQSKGSGSMSTANQQFWVKDSEHPYSCPPDKPFYWIRGYHLGGRSIMWGRQSYRLSEMDFSANAKDGHGSDWPIRYSDIAPWYDHVERFAGISGSAENLEQLPDGQFLPAMALTPAELDFKKKMEEKFPGRRLIPGRCANLTTSRTQDAELGRAPCQYRSLCDRGCAFGAYFSSLSATLPAGKRTGNLTVVTDAIAHSVIYDPKTKRATGVRVIDANTKQGTTYHAKVIFLCASTIPTAQILLNSVSDAFPNGLANRSDAVGRYLMDHNMASVVAFYPGFEDLYHRGRRPNGFYIPRYRNVSEPAKFLRGFGFQGLVMRVNYQLQSKFQPGIGAELKAKLRKPGPWLLLLAGFGEMLPNPDNRVTLHPTRKDRWGLPIVHIDCGRGDNERQMMEQVVEDATAMATAAGARVLLTNKGDGSVGLGIHEMGTAHMGRDPAKSVLNKHGQAHDVPNLFISDGAAMASSGAQNPSLTYMALSARAAHYAVEFLRSGAI
jgi:choline dehydrogenase-like flavoprotein